MRPGLQIDVFSHSPWLTLTSHRKINKILTDESLTFILVFIPRFIGLLVNSLAYLTYHYNSNLNEKLLALNRIYCLITVYHYDYHNHAKINHRPKSNV